MTQDRTLYMRQRYRKNPKRSREVHWKKQEIYNPDGTRFKHIDFDRLYQAQQGCCKICDKHQSELTRTLAADHNHKTGIIRGLLCLACNSRLWSLENEDFRKRATKYLGEL